MYSGLEPVVRESASYKEADKEKDRKQECGQRRLIAHHTHRGHRDGGSAGGEGTESSHGRAPFLRRRVEDDPAYRRVGLSAMQAPVPEALPNIKI